MSDSEHTFVCGVLQNPARMVDALDLEEGAINEDGPRRLMNLAIKYYEKRDGKNCLNLALAESLLVRKGAFPELLELVQDYKTWDLVTDPEFKHALEAISNKFRKRALKEGTAGALEAMLDNDYESAKSTLMKGLTSFGTASRSASPISIYEDRVLKDEVANLSKSPEELGSAIDIGFPRLQGMTSFRRGQLAILGGYTSDGKTQLSKTMALNAAMSGSKVLYIAMEMTYRQMLALLVSQHAANLDPSGVEYRHILDGDATDKQKALYERALRDLASSTGKMASAGGEIVIWAPGRSISFREISDRVLAMKADKGLDMVVPDYLELIEPDKDYGQYRISVGKMCDSAAHLAKEADVLILMPHQISRGGRDAAEKRRPLHYIIRDLGESSGVEKAADHVLWILSTEEFKDDRESKIGLAKSRGGETLTAGYFVMADYSRSIIAEKEF